MASVVKASHLILQCIWKFRYFAYANDCCWLFIFYHMSLAAENLLSVAHARHVAIIRNNCTHKSKMPFTYFIHTNKTKNFYNGKFKTKYDNIKIILLLPLS